MTRKGWTFFKRHGAWGYERTLNGHRLLVGPGLAYRWVAVVDDVRVGTRSTEDAAMELAEKRAA